MVVDTQPPPRSPRPLDRVLRVVDAGPRLFFRAALVSLAITSVLTIAIALYVRPAGPLPGAQRELIELAVAALCLVAALVVVSLAWPARVRAAQLDQLMSADERASVWLALTVWFPLLLVAAYLRCRSTEPPSVHWIAFGYLDKRWVSATYLLGALAPMVLLVAASRVLRVGRDHPQSWWSWLSGLLPRSRAASVADAGPEDVSQTPEGASQAPAKTRTASAGASATPAGSRAAWLRFGLGLAGVATAIGLAWYFYGPPWYLSRSTAPIGYQEDVFLAGLQAISKGQLPYIGPAAVQYGPGAQLMSYLFMRHVFTFSVIGFRESWATFQWVGASILFVAFFLAFGFARGLLVSLLSALVYPTLQQLGFSHGLSYSGFWGWANPLRYAGAVALVILLPAVIRRCPSWRGLSCGVLLGLVFGALSYMAQENLIGGIVGAVVVAVLLGLSGTSSGRAVISGLLAAAVGFLIVWLPVLAYYAGKGFLGRFIYLYFLIPQAVADGYSNTPFGGFTHKPSPWTTMFHVLPFVLALVALASVVQFRPFRVAVAWSRERILLVAIAVTTILLYQGALLRSDNAHLTGTMLAVPALVVMAATALPRVLGATGRTTLVVAGVVLFVASFALLPYASFRWTSVRSAAEGPYLGRSAPQHVVATPTTVAAERVGGALVHAKECCQSSTLPMRPFIALMNHIHTLVGDRTTYVVGFPAGYPGIVYFVADLKPAPIPLDPYTMVMTEPQLQAFLADFKHSVLPHTQALVTSSLYAPEVRDFLARYPHSHRFTLHYKRKPYYVLLAR